MSIPEGKSLEFELQLKEGIIIFKLSGDAGSINTDVIFERILSETNLYSRFVLDFGDLIYCNSRFLGQLFSLADIVDKKNGRVCISRCNEVILETLTIVGMFDVIPMIENLNEAKEYLISQKA